MNPSNTFASWRGMQLTDPPTSSAHAWLRLVIARGGKNWGSISFDVQDEDGCGITLGDIIDAGTHAEHDAATVSKSTSI